MRVIGQQRALACRPLRRSGPGVGRTGHRHVGQRVKWILRNRAGGGDLWQARKQHSIAGQGGRTRPRRIRQHIPQPRVVDDQRGPGAQNLVLQMPALAQRHQPHDRQRVRRSPRLDLWREQKELGRAPAQCLGPDGFNPGVDPSGVGLQRLPFGITLIFKGFFSQAVKIKPPDEVVYFQGARAKLLA